MFRSGWRLEVKLQCKLHYSATALVLDLTEVVYGVLRVAEAASWVARTGRACAVSGWNGDPAIADRIQRQVYIGRVRVSDTHIYHRWKCLIEHVEQSGTELNLLLFSNIEVLEEGDVEIAAARGANIERRLRWTSIRECRNRKLGEIVSLAS